MDLDELRKRYFRFYGPEPADSGALAELELSLSLRLSDDFKQIATFYSGGILGGISHHAIATSGPAANIFEETLRLRLSVGLPKSLIALAEPAESLIVMDTAAGAGSPRVIWLDATDAPRLGNLRNLRDPELWSSYGAFFDFLLREEEERSERD